MEWSEIVLVFTSLFTTLVPGIINNPLFGDYAGIFGGQSYMAQMPTSGILLGTEIEIAIRAENLRDRDLMSKSDPICYTSVRGPSNHFWSRIHQTETIDNDLSPIFAQKPVVSLFQAENTTIKFEIFDYDHLKNDSLGFAVINLGTLISTGSMALPVQKRNIIGMQSNSGNSKIIVSAERLINSIDQVTMTISAADLAKMDFASLSDPYIEVFKVSPGSNSVLVHRTEVYQNQRNVTWKQFTVPMKNLCNGDVYRPLIFVCWDWNRNAKPTLIGQFQTNLHELRDMRRTNFELSSNSTRRYAGQIMVKLDYLYGSMMHVQSVPGAFPQPGLSSHYAAAQPLPYNAMAQSTMYGMNVSTQVPNPTYIHGNASTMYPPSYPAAYPPTAPEYGTSMPVQYPGQPSAAYGHPAGSSVYPGPPPAGGGSSMFNGYGSQFYHG